MSDGSLLTYVGSHSTYPCTVMPFVAAQACSVLRSASLGILGTIAALLVCHTLQGTLAPVVASPTNTSPALYNWGLR